MLLSFQISPHVYLTQQDTGCQRSHDLAEDHIVFLHTLFSPVSRMVQLAGLAEYLVFQDGISYSEVLIQDHKILKVLTVLKM